MHRAIGLAALAVVVALGGAGCSSSDDGASTTTTAAVATSTTTTQPDISPEEIAANVATQLRPIVSKAFDAETADCVIDVATRASTGELSADDAIKAYPDECGVTMAEVSTAVAVDQMTKDGLPADKIACYRDEMAKVQVDDADDLDELVTSDIYERCGIDEGTSAGG